MTRKKKAQADAIALDCSSSADNTPIELMRMGPPKWNRPTIDDLEEFLVDGIATIPIEEIEKELADAGINMGPAHAKLREMIAAKKKETEASEKMVDTWEVWPHYDTSYDYLVTDDTTEAEEAVATVVERWMDESIQEGEELVIRVKYKQMTRFDYDEMTAPEP